MFHCWVETNLHGSLWKHQRDAVRMVGQYLRRSDAEGAKGASLVSMPTGAGKTAVAAAVIEAAATGTHWLVVTPRRALVDQFIRALDRDVWLHTGVAKPEQFPSVQELPSATQIMRVATLQEPVVFVATFQKLVQVLGKSGGQAAFAGCFANFAAVFVDEGHYEPSPTWARAVRSLNLRVVMLTATPYRNDELHIPIDARDTYWYRHHNAVEDNVIRDARFKLIEATTTQGFIDEVLTFTSAPRVKKARVIIRCATAQDIRNCVEMLEAQGKSAIGIHDTFTDEPNPSLVVDVPDVDVAPARYWVHQNKLIEGIDDHAFRVVAFHDGLANDRALVQQVGRILRRRHGSASIAHVLYRSDVDAQAAWDRFLRFDREARLSEAGQIDSFGKRIIEAQPPAAYADRQFRTPIKIEDPLLWESLAYRPSAVVFFRDRFSSADELSTKIATEYATSLRHNVAPMRPDSRTVVVCYIAFSNSDALLDGLFLEPVLGFTVVRLTESHLYLFDSQGNVPNFLRQLTPIPRERLSTLMDASAQVTNVSLTNTDIGRSAIRSRTMRAANLQDVAPGLTDYAQVCTTIQGQIVGPVHGIKSQRYLGLARSRIRDGRQDRIDFSTYCAWIDAIDHVLMDNTASATAALARYASIETFPSDPTPGHVLFDIDASNFSRIAENGEKVTPVIEDLAVLVTRGELTLSIDSQLINARLKWIPSTRRYRLESLGIDDLGYCEASGRGRSMRSVINSDQLMSIVPLSLDCRYVGGRFLEIPAPHTGIAGRSLVDALIAMPALVTASTEKSEPVGASWSRTSVFGVIDALRRGHNAPAEMGRYFSDLDTLVCTDLGTELCDFLAIQDDRISLIHAKCDGGKGKSVSSLQEVVAQAVKNLLYLQPSYQDLPPGTWDGVWNREKKEGSLPRIRLARRGGKAATTAEIWNYARAVITNPAADREVWIVMSGGIRKSALREELDAPKPSAEMIQLFALLQSAYDTVSAVGARLRIFCRP